jgi:allantoicase
LNDFTKLVDLASERLGGRVLAANDEFFAPKENLLKSVAPIFVEGKFTNRGKWMDGWETRRRRQPGHDWCIFRLGLPGIVRGVVVDTSHFKGNFPEYGSIEACAIQGSPSMKQLLSPTAEWFELLPKSQLKGDTQNSFPIEMSPRCTHLRLNIYPDGGVARLRVHGDVVPSRVRAGREMDLAAVASGACVIASSDEFFSSPLNLLMPGRAKNMGDGWETRRRRGPGHDWVILKLGVAGKIRRVEVDTAHFKGNFPESCSLEACCSAASTSTTFDPRSAGVEWTEILPRTKLRANSRHIFGRQIRNVGRTTHVRFSIFPDGGVSRLRIFGVAVPGGDVGEGLRRLNSLSAKQAEAVLLDCCGSREWARRMGAARPFENAAQLFEAADKVCSDLGREDWLEAFHHHPPIGGKRSKEKQSASARDWSAKEQAGMRKASRATVAALVEANHAYRKRFGYIFIVCAAGKSSEEMLSILRQRLENDPEIELRVAAEEQRRITRLRLEKVLER